MMYFTFSGVHCIGYEGIDNQLVNWSSAAIEHVNPASLLARISSITELCDAQTELQTDHEYWTALKRNNTGMYQWGHLPNNSANPSTELLENTQPENRCYVISKSAMKLKSKDCGSLQRVLLATDGELIKTSVKQSTRKPCNFFRSNFVIFQTFILP